MGKTRIIAAFLLMSLVFANTNSISSQSKQRIKTWSKRITGVALIIALPLAIFWRKNICRVLVDYILPLPATQSTDSDTQHTNDTSTSITSTQGNSVPEQSEQPQPEIKKSGKPANSPAQQEEITPELLQNVRSQLKKQDKTPKNNPIASSNNKYAKKWTQWIGWKQ